MILRWNHDVHLDFESFATANLKHVGAAKYWKHSDTLPMCVGFKWEEKDYQIRCNDDGSFDADCEDGEILRERAADPKTRFIAHNAPFEQWGWEEYMVPVLGFYPIAIERWMCTMAMCYRHGIPGSLDGAGKVLNLPIQKDQVGYNTMIRLSKPRRITKKNPDKKRWLPSDVPDDFEILYSYNITDLDAETGLCNKLRKLTKNEQRIWCIDQRINRQGVHIDKPAVEKAEVFFKTKKKELLTEFEIITGVASPLQRAKFKDWLHERGVMVPNTQAPTIKKVLVDRRCPDDVRNALTLTQQITKTSLAKLAKILQLCDEKGILYDVLQYHGTFTGRWAGRGAQIHNLPRPKLDVDLCLDILMHCTYEQFKMFYPDVLEALSSALRGFLIPPPGHDFFIADFAQFESRLLAYLAGQKDKLELFARGEDLYCYIASQLYGYLVNKNEHPEERQCGKLGDLSCGYRGGIGAIARFSKVYDVNLKKVFYALWPSATEKEKKNARFCYKLYKKTAEEPIGMKAAFGANIIKDRWREAHPAIVDFWTELEIASCSAVMDKKGRSFKAGEKIEFFMDDIFLHAKMPCGGTICYPYPKVKENKRGKLILSYYSADDRGRIETHGGKVSENLTQAFQRSFLAAAMQRHEISPYPLAFHEHDEGIGIVKKGEGDLVEFERIMAKNPDFALDLPIGVEGWRGTRYGKK